MSAPKTGKGSVPARWSSGVLEQVARVLGDSCTGLTNDEITRLLPAVGLEDPGSGTKWKRLAQAFNDSQIATGSATRVLRFIKRAMDPAGYVGQSDAFTTRQDGLNEVLAFVGLRITDKGEAAYGARAATLDEAAQLAESLRAELRRRNTHANVLCYCEVELLRKSSFHATSEAAKGVFQRLRQMSGFGSDGADLVDAAVMPGRTNSPIVRINAYDSETCESEQRGFGLLLKGIYGMYRNPLAHDPRENRTVTNDELLEFFTTLSMVHRRLDLALVTSRAA